MTGITLSAAVVVQAIVDTHVHANVNLGMTNTVCPFQIHEIPGRWLTHGQSLKRATTYIGLTLRMRLQNAPVCAATVRYRISSGSTAQNVNQQAACMDALANAQDLGPATMTILL